MGSFPGGINRRLAGLAGGLLAVATLAVLGRGGPAADAAPYERDVRRCDFLDPANCLYPFPNDYFTRRDRTTQTGRRLALEPEAMPVNTFGRRIHPGPYNYADGFSPGQLIVTKVPGLETPQALRRTGAVPITDIGRYREPNQPVVVINARTGERHPIWVEIDSNAAEPADAALLIRPAVNFEEGERYIVALRYLRNAAGNELEPQTPFRILRDRVDTGDRAIAERQRHFERLFSALGASGIERDDLYLAWDFTVASADSTSSRMLAIRDDAFAELGDRNLSNLKVEGRAPGFQVTSVIDYAPCGDDGCSEGTPGPSLPILGAPLSPITQPLSTALGNPPEDDEIARRVEGTFKVPCYLDLPGCPTGGRFVIGANGLPRENLIEHTASFTCLIPRTAVSGAAVQPARPSLYGHGLLGSASEVGAGNVQAMAFEHNFVFCATDWIGFATQDLPTVVTILSDLNNFPKLVDRTQQGFLNFMYLGRLLIHPQGFASSAAFQAAGEAGGALRSVINPRRLYYDGNSQGGILGGGLTAVAPDFNRAVLGVPGMNYSTLLERSSDFPPYAEGDFCSFFDQSCDTPLGLYDSYPDQLERPLLFSLMQLLWDRGEANGYAAHMTADPLPDTPRHTVLMHAAYGDHQVSNWAAEVEARTIGARAHEPALDRGRHPARDPLWGIPPIPSYPYRGSALVYWDTGPVREVGGELEGTGPLPATNTAPLAGDDPHGAPRSDEHARRQKSRFLRPKGRVVDVCGGAPCYADGWTGRGGNP